MVPHLLGGLFERFLNNYTQLASLFVFLFCLLTPRNLDNLPIIFARQKNNEFLYRTRTERCMGTFRMDLFVTHEITQMVLFNAHTWVGRYWTWIKWRTHFSRGRDFFSSFLLPRHKKEKRKKKTPRCKIPSGNYLSKFFFFSSLYLLVPVHLSVIWVLLPDALVS